MEDSTSFLFVPLPFTKGQIAAQGDQQTIQLSAPTRTETATAENFQNYIKKLVTLPLLGHTFPSCWSNPFRSQESEKGDQPIIELFATIWNYSAWIHQQVSKVNCTELDGLRAIKYLLVDFQACLQNMKNLMPNVLHPIFTNSLLDMVESYHNYMYSFLFLQLSKSQKSTNTKNAKYSHRCLLDVLEMEKRLIGLDQHATSFFQPLIATLKIYFTSLTGFYMGMMSVDEAEYGKAVKYLKDASDLMNSCPKISFGYIVQASVDLFKGTLKRMYDKIEYDRVHIACNAFVVKEVPPFLGAFNRQTCDANNDLILQNLPPPPDFPYQPPEIPIPIITPIYAPEPIPNPIPQQFPNPIQQPVPTPAPQPMIPPNPMPAPPPIFAPIIRPEFSRWEKLLFLKQQVHDRLNRLSSVPNYRRVIDALNDYCKTADPSDQIIDDAIRVYPNQPGVEQHHIDECIDKAFRFYNQIVNRIDTLESTGN